MTLTLSYFRRVHVLSAANARRSCRSSTLTAHASLFSSRCVQLAVPQSTMSREAKKSLPLLGSRASIPTVGLGTYCPKESEDDVIPAVKAAVKAGYRHLDCAAIYRNERAVGHAIKQLIVEGVVQREDLFITSKLWNTCHRPDLVRASLKKSLEDLGLKYLDLYLMHWPMAYKEGPDLLPKDENGKVLFSDVDYMDTWKALEDCVDEGLTHHIGMSNFNREQIDRVLENCKIKPVCNQIEVHCYLGNRKMVEFCQSKGIVVVAFAPLGNNPNPSSGSASLLADPVLKEIAEKKGKTPAQVALRFLVQQDIAVIPKSVTPARITQNIEIFDFELTEEEMGRLRALDRKGRGYCEDFAVDHKYYPFHEEY